MMSPPASPAISPVSLSPPPQEERLLEKDSALWRLQGDPTVLITLAHIFNHFAPLMVRRSSQPPWGLAAVLLTTSGVVWLGKLFTFLFSILLFFIIIETEA